MLTCMPLRGDPTPVSTAEGTRDAEEDMAVENKAIRQSIA